MATRFSSDLYYYLDPMDEYNRGMDPELKQYFRKIVNSFSIGCLWLIVFSTAGLFFQLAFIRDGIKWYNILFYTLFLVSFLMLLRYLNRQWIHKKNDPSVPL